jgi:hypothetical protein
MKDKVIERTNSFFLCNYHSSKIIVSSFSHLRIIKRRKKTARQIDYKCHKEDKCMPEEQLFLSWMISASFKYCLLKIPRYKDNCLAKKNKRKKNISSIFFSGQIISIKKNTTLAFYIEDYL